MLAWDQALYGDKLLDGAARRAMFTDYGRGYGYGWSIDAPFGHARVGHNGAVNGFVSQFARYTDDRLTVILLSNQTNAPVGRIADDLAAIYLHVPDRTGAPGGEAALRRLIGYMGGQAPDYDQMTTRFGNILRPQLEGLRGFIKGLGPLQTIRLVQAHANGADRWRVQFEKGALEWNLTLDGSGKYVESNFRLLIED